MAPYIYQRLKTPENDHAEFRLVTLHHGTPIDEIKVSIDVHSLPLADDVQFAQSPGNISWQALSYTWGELSDVEEIFVTDPNPGLPLCELKVTKTLAEALRHIRSYELDRLMWIDAICINQSNDEAALQERAWQVRYMHQIFSQADGVILWLGPEADDSSHALQQLDALGSSVDVDWWEYEVSSAGGESSNSMQMYKDSGYTSREQRAVRALLDRPYFERVWVKQESLLSREARGFVQAGNSSICLYNFRKAIFLLLMVVGIDVRSPNMVHEVNRQLLALSLCSTTYLEPTKLMDRTRRCKCSDPRDKVYANLGLMALNEYAGLANMITVDYSEHNTVRKTYADFFLQYTQYCNTLNLLMFSGLSQSNGMRPTWVPDWRTVERARMDCSILSATSHFITAEADYLGGHSLQVIGKYATTIVHIRRLEPDVDLEVKTDWYNELARLMRDHFHPLHVDRGAEMLAQAIEHGTTELDAVSKRIFFERYLRALYDVVTRNGWRMSDGVPLPSEHLDEQASTALGNHLKWFKLYGAPFIFSADGHIGVGPWSVEIGDEVYAILGCRAPMVLRPISHEGPSKGYYQVIGPCFMHGLN